MANLVANNFIESNFIAGLNDNRSPFFSLNLGMNCFDFFMFCFAKVRIAFSTYKKISMDDLRRGQY